MPKTIKAVTVTRDYLNRWVWVVKTLAVFNRKDGTPYWYVTQTIDSDPNELTMLSRALHYCVEKGVAFVSDVKHGQDLTDEHKGILKVYDMLEK